MNWGNHKKHGGGRSVMLVAIRLLFVLGVRRVFLLGADFKMDETRKYHFDQDRAPGSIRGNNSSYDKLNNWLRKLRPMFEKQHFYIFNCNPDSNLEVFEHVSFTDAVTDVHQELGNINLGNERTSGLYDQDKPKGGK